MKTSSKKTVTTSRTRRFAGLTAAEVRGLVARFGHPDNDALELGDAPPVPELLALAGDFPGITYHGRIVREQRNHPWVAVEGFRATGLNDEQMLYLLTKYLYAWGLCAGWDTDGTRWVRTCWY